MKLCEDPKRSEQQDPAQRYMKKRPVIRPGGRDFGNPGLSGFEPQVNDIEIALTKII
jgi:hypothetical protein